ncbi:hypothetical protein [Meiothermus granaticius]|uniref:Uncharacterized protein n=1 Tax=Meiothermus granaticius NBRC 107808 TaxID=1227551 RepID=A0A399F577_9DEIN|nr:hypothetical protein [Meiothermus granaticius]MCL6526815.1 hypothetical protein [Thermaceae bacterium]RIH90915.1 hypothetical protein Mgrana_03131 [Meiothermus granaticius NBRC 107808]GEM87193.1 hypothetical protein MGR01S_18180 [Meiothermus granaticius NBRC 107808]
MSQGHSYLLQIWRDEKGIWAVLKPQQGQTLLQFDNLEALAQFLSSQGPTLAETEEDEEAVPPYALVS